MSDETRVSIPSPPVAIHVPSASGAIAPRQFVANPRRRPAGDRAAGVASLNHAGHRERPEDVVGTSRADSEPALNPGSTRFAGAGRRAPRARAPGRPPGVQTTTSGVAASTPPHCCAGPIDETTSLLCGSIRSSRPLRGSSTESTSLIAAQTSLSGRRDRDDLAVPPATAAVTSRVSGSIRTTRFFGVAHPHRPAPDVAARGTPPIAIVATIRGAATGSGSSRPSAADAEQCGGDYRAGQPCRQRPGERARARRGALRRCSRSAASPRAATLM